MQLFPLGRVYDFMGQRRIFITLSLIVFLSSLVSIWYPGLHLGTDFRGGTEIEVAFKQPVDAAEVRAAVVKSGFSSPDVVRVDDTNAVSHFIVRVQEVTTIAPEKQEEIEKRLCYGEDVPADQCPANHQATEVKFSPGGDKITIRFREAPDLDWIKSQLTGVQGIAMRVSSHNPFIQNARDHKVEVQLMSKGDQLMDGLRRVLGSDKVPDTALRSEWIGPKAGAQLRDAALKAVAIAIVFIMAYIAFRFDLRFAPGAVIALIHDAVAVLGYLVLAHREVNLTTVAAVLTVVGYSVNDTVIVYDRVRENLGRLRGATFASLINVSLSDMLSRTILTAGTTVVSLVAFFIWGTGVLKDFALALIVGITLGTYSSIYVALPLTEWLDRTFFAKVSPKKKGFAERKKKQAPAAA